MRKINLIYLGALCQTQFEMKPGFEIVEYPPDSEPLVRVWVQPPSPSIQNSGPYAAIDFDVIELKKIGNLQQGETMWAGYSAKANILAIKEPLK